MSEGKIPSRPEGEPHLSFDILLADTLTEMERYESSIAEDSDSLSVLFDETAAVFRTESGDSQRLPLHNSYKDNVLAPKPASALDVRY